jgi:hypothetical protein
VITKLRLMPQSKVQGSILGILLTWNIQAADLGSDIDSVVSFTVVPVYDEIGGEEEEGDDDEDTGDQPSNICIHIIGRAVVT